MEVWINERRPEVMCMANVTIAFVVHVVVFMSVTLSVCFFYRLKAVNPRHAVEAAFGDGAKLLRRFLLLD